MASPATRSSAPTRRRRFFDYPRAHVTGLRRWLPSWRVVVGTVLAVVALVTGVVIAAWATTDVPKELPSAQDQSSTLYFSDGTTEMASFYVDGGNRASVSYGDLPKYVGDSVVASEDTTFWTNQGVDPKGIVRAAVNNVRGGGRQGASTLTQQYAERYYTGTTTSYAGKVKEVLLALKITQDQPKQEILENYLNTIYFGRGAYGIEQAAQTYYGIPAADMTVSQSALLAGIIPAPSSWDPASNPEMAEQRWNRVLDHMVTDGYLTAQDRKDATFPKTLDKKTQNRYKGTNGYLVQMARDELVKSGRFTEDDLDTGGYKIVTTVDKDMQKQAVKAAQSLPDDADKNIRVSLVSTDPKTSGIRALYGGPDAVKQAYNTSTLGAAQAGSTFKPFTLIAGLENGKTLQDSYNGNDPQQYGDWKVTNFGHESLGSNTSLLRGLTYSVNTVFGGLNVDIGPDKTADVAKRLGITEKVDPVPSNVLGITHVHGVDLANAYNTIADGGQYSPVHIVDSVSTRAGETVFTGAKAPKRVVDQDIINGVTYAMTQVVQEGSGREALALDRPVAGKTGTSNSNRSAWFAGFVPQLTTVVGIYQVSDDGKSEEEIQPFGEWKQQGRTITGSTFPARAWTEYMQAVLKDEPVEDFPEYVAPTPTWSPEPEETQEPQETQEPEETKSPEPKEIETVDVPGGLVGTDSGSASGALSAAGLNASITEEYSDQPKGTVLRVLGKSSVPAGSTIGLVVSKGPDPTKVEPKPEPTQTQEPEDPQPTPTQTDDGGGDGGGDDQGDGTGDKPGDKPGDQAKKALSRLVGD
ncbi:transglycosylase domain-containing protein [Cellulomonas sp. PhB143]|uniref:transglycosylase domain-containing protein n=1 Tax=Cellulomonas sp. PhB143 TaxID=2485186 RepID=UPI000F489BFF|nr:transglycosylase domain-containing protein [Cellulomonas sp. PhB143]ROS75523.1 membrane peptidoglycan carboxypeptidase [Cellulomonas sp. PhB143]